MTAYKKEAEKAKSAKAKTTSSDNTSSEPFTFEDFKYLVIFGAFVALAIATSFIVAIIVAVIILIVLSVIEVKNEEENNSQLISQEEIEELHRHLANIDAYKDVANNSADTYAVKCAIDELLIAIDFIMNYDEDILNSVGMSKLKLPSQRDIIIQHYDDLINQAKERSKENSENTV